MWLLCRYVEGGVEPVYICFSEGGATLRNFSSRCLNSLRGNALPTNLRREGERLAVDRNSVLAIQGRRWWMFTSKLYLGHVVFALGQ